MKLPKPTFLDLVRDEQDFIHGVRRYADANYDNGGWDEVCEAWDD